MADEQLTTYIKSCLASNVPTERIKSDLYAAGWKKADVEEALASVTGGRKPQPQKPEKSNAGPSKKKFYAMVAVIIIIAGAATYYLVSTYLLSIPNEPQIIPQNTTYACPNGVCESAQGETYEVCPSDCQVPQQATTSIAMKAPASASKGGSVSLDVEISSVSNLYGFQFDITYNPAGLQYQSATEGPFLSKSKADSTYCIPTTTASGRATVVCTRMGPIGGVSGSGVLGTVVFSALETGTYQLSLEKVKLVDYSIKEISIDIGSPVAVTISG